MSSKGQVVLLLAASLFLAGCSLPFARQKAGLQVTVNPQANVFLDGKALGQTPVYNEALEAATYTVKVTANDPTLLSWEGKVTLRPGVLTVIDRQLASENNKTHGYVLSFEKLTKKDAAEVSLVSSPDTISITVDGAPVGFTPLKSDSLAVGPHSFTLTSPGFQDKVIKASVKAGYRLEISVQLAAQTITPPPPPATPSATPTPTPLSGATPSIKSEITPLPKQATGSAVTRPYVEILATPTNFLRVRAQPSSSSTELAKVNPGDRFSFVASDSAQTWYQILYLPDQKGWVSATYAKLFP